MKKKTKGLTLLEVTISIALLMVITLVYISNTKNLLSTDSRTYQQEILDIDNRVAMVRAIATNLKSQGIEDIECDYSLSDIGYVNIDNKYTVNLNNYKFDSDVNNQYSISSAPVNVKDKTTIKRATVENGKIYITDVVTSMLVCDNDMFNGFKIKCNSIDNMTTLDILYPQNSLAVKNVKLNYTELNKYYLNIFGIKDNAINTSSTLHLHYKEGNMLKYKYNVRWYRD